MTGTGSEHVAASFVIAHVGTQQLGIDVANVAEVLNRGTGDPSAGFDVESMLGMEPSSDVDRMLLRLRRGSSCVDLEVPGADLQIGRHLSGPCQRPRLVAGALARCCLKGVVMDGDSLVYLLDLDRFWSRFAEPSTEGESS